VKGLSAHGCVVAKNKEISLEAKNKKRINKGLKGKQLGDVFPSIILQSFLRKKQPFGTKGYQQHIEEDYSVSMVESCLELLILFSSLFSLRPVMIIQPLFLRSINWQKKFAKKSL